MIHALFHKYYTLKEYTRACHLFAVVGIVMRVPDKHCHVTKTNCMMGHCLRSLSTIHPLHYDGVIMSTVASQITSLTIDYSTVIQGGNQRKHQSSASLAFVRGIHWWPVNSPHKGPVTRKLFPFDDVIIKTNCMKWLNLSDFNNMPCKSLAWLNSSANFWYMAFRN